MTFVVLQLVQRMIVNNKSKRSSVATFELTPGIVFTVSETFCIQNLLQSKKKKSQKSFIRSAVSQCLFGLAAAEVGMRWEKSNRCVYIRERQPAFTKLKPGGCH